VIYGCDNYFGLFHGRYATLLSRTEFLESKYVDRAVKTMRKFEYDTSFWWVNTGSECNFEADKSYDQKMIDAFEFEPEWSWYNENSEKTLRVK
jgi:hypothetical protein